MLIYSFATVEGGKINRSTIMLDLYGIKRTLQRDADLDFGGADLCFIIQFPGKGKESKEPIYGRVIFEEGNVHVKRTDSNGECYQVGYFSKQFRTLFHMVKVCKKRNVSLSSRVFVKTRAGLAGLHSFYPAIYSGM